jgi:hypothetical protein
MNGRPPAALTHDIKNRYPRSAFPRSGGNRLLQRTLLRIAVHWRGQLLAPASASSPISHTAKSSTTNSSTGS